MRFCTRCGNELKGARFCIRCGAPAEEGVPHVAGVGAAEGAASTAGPHRDVARRTPRLAAGVVVSALLVTGGIWWLWRPEDAVTVTAGRASSSATPSERTGQEPEASPTVASPPATTPTTEDPSPEPSTPPASEASSPAVGTPAWALTLPEDEALDLLRGGAEAHSGFVAALAGSWVPQVSSKCRGLTVDIGPEWFPDGEPETVSVSDSQILAFHLALFDRHGALMTTAQLLGSQSIPATCSADSLFVSLVPIEFPSAAQANDWCGAQGYPPGECGARLVLEPGAEGTRYVAQDGA